MQTQSNASLINSFNSVLHPDNNLFFMPYQTYHCQQVHHTLLNQHNNKRQHPLRVDQALQDLQYLFPSATVHARNKLDMSVDVAKTFANVPKFAEDGSNYTIFSTCITLAIRAAKGSFALTRVPDPAQQDEVEKDEQLLNAIVSLLPDKVFRKFLKKDKTFVMLEALKAHYNIKLMASVAITKAHLFMIECKNNKHFDKTLDEIEQTKEQLDDLGHAINDASYISAIVKATPKAFQSIIDSSTNAIDTYNLINPAVPRRLTPTMLLTALREGHLKHNLLNLVKKSEQANYANNNSNSGKEGGSGRGGSRGRGCGQGGRGGRGRGSNQGSAYSEHKCYNCGGKGHYSKMCPSPKHDQANKAMTDAKGKEEDKKKKDDKPKDTKPQQQQQQAQLAFIEEITNKTAWSAQTDQHIRIDAFDSGASLHLTPEKDRLLNVRSCDPVLICAANGSTFQANLEGELNLVIPNGNNRSIIPLRNVKYAPAMHSTLISILKLDADGYKVLIGNNRLTISSPSGKFLGLIERFNDIYATCWHDHCASLTDTAFSVEKLSLSDIHWRLGHINYGYLQKMIRDGKLVGMALDETRSEEEECVPCILAKIRHTPIPHQQQSKLATAFSDHFHMDIWGPAKVCASGHGLYALTIVDDATRWLQMSVMQRKSNSFARYVAWQTFLKTNFGNTIKQLQSDNDGAFLSSEFKSYLESMGTEQCLTVHDTPQQNGVAECTHGTIFNAIRANMNNSALPIWLWRECLGYVTFIYNQTPNATLNYRSPYEARFGQIPDLSDIYQFGQPCVVHLETAPKLGDRGTMCRWLGPDEKSNGHRIYHPTQHKISIERNIVMLKLQTPDVQEEKECIDIGPDSENVENLRQQTNLPSVPDERIPTPEPTTRPKRNQKLTRCTKGLELMDEDPDDQPAKEEANEVNHVEAMLASGGDPLDDPTTISQLGKCANGDYWWSAMHEEVHILEKRGTWEYAGFTQVDGVDYYSDNTFAPVTQLSSVHSILSYAAANNWEIHQINIKLAYLYGELEDDETIFMRPPQHYELDGIQPGQVLRLRKALYGLKQAGQHCILFSHVDDLTLISNETSRIRMLKDKIGVQVEYTDGGEINWLLGVEIKWDRTKRTIMMRQFSYLETILTRYGFQDARPTNTPMDPHLQLSIEQCPMANNEIAEMSKRPYAVAVGALHYAADVTRPDIAYAVGQLARYLRNPSFTHWTAFLSTTEAEYVALTHTAHEAIWLHTLLSQVFKLESLPVEIHCNNQSAIVLSAENRFHARTKHIDIQYHFICQCIADGKILVPYVPTDDQEADIFTKALPPIKVKRFTDRLGFNV
ncbi:hypothetical protein EW145_g7048 [Phellinidium pouzarii]|uniref:Integrase catalytic domain-containing protein n=1 Tax=Phellinidium pouzarii TaxID=167371 RepID=A0A4S4KUG1_9AGAM|nr:hypothetical protein EW145_g7048 [Phellinidium pouzarii]